MATTAPLSIRPARPEDEGAILEAFRRVIAGARPRADVGGGRPDGASPIRTADEWHWRYGAHPLGRRAMIALDEEGRVLAHYAGLPQRALVDGEPALHLQAVDSFCDPSRRGGLARAGLFVRVGRAFAQVFVGPPGNGVEQTEEKASFIWGLPVLPAWRSGRDHLGYGQLRRMLLLSADPEDLRTAHGDGKALEIAEWGPAEPIPACMDELARLALIGTRAGVLRDRAWMQWRYRERPEVDYHLALVQRAGQPLGAAVAREGEFDGRRGLLLCEWIVAPVGEPDQTRAALLVWARDRARATGVSEIIAHLGERAAEFLPLQEAGFVVRATGRTVAARSFHRRRDLVWFADHLEVSLGDTDLV